MPEPTVDWSALTEELTTIATESLTELAEGAEADLKSFGAEIAGGMIVALRAGDKELREELKLQLRALGEVHRIRLVQEQWDAVSKALSIAMRVGGTVLAAAV